MAGFRVGRLKTALAAAAIDFAVDEDLHAGTARDMVMHLGVRWTW